MSKFLESGGIHLVARYTLSGLASITIKPPGKARMRCRGYGFIRRGVVENYSSHCNLYMWCLSPQDLEVSTAGMHNVSQQSRGNISVT